MYRDRTVIRSRKLMSFWFKRIFLNALILICFHAAIIAQETQRTQPTWWVGGAAAANLNFYGGTTQMLNSDLTTPAAFHKGFGTGLYLAALVEYRPDSVWGGILQVGYDDRSGSFDDVLCPCGEDVDLIGDAQLSYHRTELTVCSILQMLFTFLEVRESVSIGLLFREMKKHLSIRREQRSDPKLNLVR